MWLLVVTANIRLAVKYGQYKQSSLFCAITCDEEKKPFQTLFTQKSISVNRIPGKGFSVN